MHIGDLADVPSWVEGRDAHCQTAGVQTLRIGIVSLMSHAKCDRRIYALGESTFCEVPKHFFEFLNKTAIRRDCAIPHAYGRCGLGDAAYNSL